MPDSDLTELVDLDVDRIDGVKSPANGFPFLILKSLPNGAPEPEPEPAVENLPDKEPASKMTDTQTNDNDTQTTEAPEPQAALTKEVLEEVLTKANEPLTQKLESLEERLSKVEQTEIPGPVVTAQAPVEKSQKLLEAKRLRQTASRVTDRELAAFYMAKALEIEKSA